MSLMLKIPKSGTLRDMVSTKYILKRGFHVVLDGNGIGFRRVSSLLKQTAWLLLIIFGSGRLADLKIRAGEKAASLLFI